jgi:hypothetical protein
VREALLILLVFRFNISHMGAGAGRLSRFLSPCVMGYAGL